MEWTPEQEEAQGEPDLGVSNTPGLGPQAGELPAIQQDETIKVRSSEVQSQLNSDLLPP